MVGSLKIAQMRIIGGSLKGRSFKAPGNLPTRPTTDHAKEGLFNVLHHRVELQDLDVLDLFSGIGSISLEFASRGARSVTSVDDHPPCVAFLKNQSAQFGMENIYTMKIKAQRFLQRCSQQFDIVFADPPYSLKVHEEIHNLIFEKKILKENGLFILEHDKTLDTSGWSNFIEQRNYGKVLFSIFRLEPE